MTENRHEHAAREEKARKMADWAHNHEISAHQLFVMPDEHWVELAFRTGIENTEVSEATRKRVVQLVEGLERPASELSDEELFDL